jgi:RNA polymerase sigma-70 factor (ECF subfamily)
MAESVADDQGFETRLDRQQISDAMSQLCPAHRAVIRRAYYLGWATAQVAGDLRITDAMVKCRLHDALHALRFTLKDMTA